jgi:polysaccharide export outer membrane protein
MISFLRLSLSSMPLMVGLLMLFGCAADERFEATTSLEEFQRLYAKKQEDSRSSATFTAPEIIDIQSESAYLLGGGDLLAINVFESEKLSTEVRVSSRGIINVPLIGDVNVMNLTAADVEQKIEDMYRKDYIHDPHVSVYIKEHMSRQITLVGAVEKPGTFDYVAQRRLLDVLAIANGLRDDAGSLASITRNNPKTNEQVSYIINLEDLIENGNMAHNHVILGGDVIFIPESGQCFVDGAVRKPGTYPLESNMTITEAIAQAGGLAGYADDDAIKLIRFMGRSQERQVVSLSYSDLQAGLGDTLLLKDQDIVFVESSASGKFFSGAGFTLGFMGTGISYKDPDQ